LEIGALFALFIAGWEISQQPINLWALLILILGVVPFIIAVRKTRKLVYLIVALIAFIIGSAYLFRSPDAPWWQPGVNPILAIVTSLIASGYVWIATTKVLESDKIRPRHDLSKIIGSIGEARTDIFDEGSVQINAELWSARSSAPIPSGSKVRVVKLDGFTLEVEPDTAKNK
jgi:membrane-bound serine protease (ClpP class)